MRKAVEIAVFVCLLAFLGWVPMPFGSASDASQPFLILPPLVICVAASLLRAFRKTPFELTPPARIWITGGALFALVIALQLLPLPMAVLGTLSPKSAEVWAHAARAAALAGVHTGTAHPITIDPAQTALHLYRVLAYFATFLASLILVRDRNRRTIFAFLLSGVAVFEALYAIREAALGRFAIWGWKNTLIYGRPSGTFVNPNHFAHYAAIVLPMGLYLSAYAWHTAAPVTAPFGRRLVAMMERHLALFGCGLIAALGCITAVLVSESRGAVLAIVGGFGIAGALASGTQRALTRGLLIALGITAAIVVATLVLGRTGTLSRFETSQGSQVESRRESAVGAVRIWQMFPLFGSGAGTYEDAVLMTRVTAGDTIYNHAHDDFAEILGTTGALGFIVSVVSLLGGFAALTRNAFAPSGEPMSWRRRAFKAAALTSLAIAMLHALIDFNFFIPANPITLAAIAGAAVAARES
ncbi:MAG TPA: O-antigen ligase family protein [Thermoanaerobaculia bacterium]|jgi:O-antigen ligase|nr:O-antigen ligase family protein [Thermoanaerobaculia bacterium]